MRKVVYVLPLCVSLIACGQPVAPRLGPQPQAADLSALLAATNQARAQGRRCPDGVFYPAAAPLSASALLSAAAQGYAQLLASSDTFPTDSDHTDPSGQTFVQRIEAAGYMPSVSGASYELGENVQGGDSSAEAVVAAFLNSAHHCPNLMNPDFRELGVGHVTVPGSTYQDYWVQDLGVR